MSVADDRERLRRRRAELDDAVLSAIAPPDLPAPRRGPSSHGDGVRRHSLLAGRAPLAATGGRPARTLFSDDERSVRALAKRIKTLIIEDIRRGIGFGG